MSNTKLNVTFKKRNVAKAVVKKVTVEEHRSETSHLGPGDSPTPELTTYGGIKLGWIQGVLIPCLLNIWGVMLFLRIAWVVAQAGIGFTIAIILVSSCVCIVTTLSLSAICTNGQVQGGGVYYLVSRSLGAELGASVGIMFAFANAVAASMNTIGFCESLNELLLSHGLKIMDNGVNDIRIVGTIALFVMCLICAVGMDWETKTQNFLIVVIVLAIMNYTIGSFIGPRTDKQKAQGFVGLNSDTALANWGPDFRDNNDIFTVFALYFPSVTGVQAGANICGDLRNPADAIPKGTLLALAISITSYLVMAVLAGTGAVRDATGRIGDYHNNTLDSCKPNCNYGLQNNHEIMQLMSLWGPLIYAGCFAATLSTALTNLLSVPRLIQALGIDRIYPGLLFFAKRYGKHGEPYRGYVLTFFVSFGFVMIADLDKVAPLITNFYLASYALINFCTFHAALISHHSWRPTFQYYNTWLSLIGFLMCAAIMVMISWVMALATVAIFLTLYLVVLYRQPEASWGSSTEAYRYREMVTSILTLTQQTEHSKSYNPQLLVLAGNPTARTALLDVAHLITKSGSFMLVGDIIDEPKTYSEIMALKQEMNAWLSSRKYRAFYCAVQAGFESGARTLVQCAGLGRLAPNILLVGYKHEWANDQHTNVATYVRVLQYAFDQQLAVCVFRMPESYQPSATSSSHALSVNSALELQAHTRVLEIMHSTSNIQLGSNTEGEVNERSNDTTVLMGSGNENREERDLAPKSDSSPSVAMRMSPPRPPLHNKSYFFKPLVLDPATTLDAWWLYDDGGLNILLPYIIANRGMKSKMPLRVFSLPRPHLRVEAAKKHMEALLAMFRIEYIYLEMVTTLGNPPADATWEFFNDLVVNFKDVEYAECRVTNEELKKHRDKTALHLRLRELLFTNSISAGLIVMSLPRPRQSVTSSALYMCWLETLSRGLPPTLFVRGNDVSVLSC